MKRFLICLCVCLGVTVPVIAKQPLLVFQNGKIVYDNTKNIQDIRSYNAEKLPPGYKRVCNNRYSKHDYRNKDCVYLPHNANKSGSGYEYRGSHIENNSHPNNYHPNPMMENSPYNR